MTVTSIYARLGLPIASQGTSTHNSPICGRLSHGAVGHHAISVLILSGMASRARGTGENPVTPRDALTERRQEVTFTSTAR